MKYLLFFTLVLLASTGAQPAFEDIGCPEYPYPEYSYQFHESSTNIFAHDLECGVQTNLPNDIARLVVLDDQVKSNCLIKYIIQRNNPIVNENYAIGLRDEQYEGVWEWQNFISRNETAAVIQPHWLPGYPSGTNNENCAFMTVNNDGVAYNGWWQDTSCFTDGFWSICEKVLL